RPREQPAALAPLRPAVVATTDRRHASPLLAAGLSLLLPGAGQLYAGNVLTAVLWFLLVTARYTLVLPRLGLHLFCVPAAAGGARRLNYSLARLQLEAG